jgi:hypothetical protein
MEGAIHVVEVLGQMKSPAMKSGQVASILDLARIQLGQKATMRSSRPRGDGLGVPRSSRGWSSSLHLLRRCGDCRAGGKIRACAGV